MGANGIGYAEVLMLFVKLPECNVIDPKETKRNGRVSFCTPVAGYTIYSADTAPGIRGNLNNWVWGWS